MMMRNRMRAAGIAALLTLGTAAPAAATTDELSITNGNFGASFNGEGGFIQALADQQLRNVLDNILDAADGANAEDAARIEAAHDDLIAQFNQAAAQGRTLEFFVALGDIDEAAGRIVSAALADRDPYVAFGADVVNTSEAPLSVSFGGFFPIEPLDGPLLGQTRLEINLIDANGDGAASITPVPGVSPFLTDFQGDDASLFSVFPSNPVGEAIIGETETPLVFDTGVGPAPLFNPGLPVNSLFYRLAFTLSPGDRVEVGVFFGAFDDESFLFPADLAIDVARILGGLGDFGAGAPAAAVPVPASAPMFAAALVGMALLRRRARARRFA